MPIIIFVIMLNTVITTIFSEEYGEIDIRVNAEHQKSAEDFDNAEVYSIWNSAGEHLGFFIRKNDELWYKGAELRPHEQEQVSDFIEAYRGGDWDL